MVQSALNTTLKQIKRSGWLAWASVAVMTLAFLVTSIFVFLAYSSNLFLTSIEQEPQIYAFFEVDTEEEFVLSKKAEWERIEGVAYVEYTSQEQAKAEFYQTQLQINELAAEAIESRELPASLAIRLDNLEVAEKVAEQINQEKETTEEIQNIRFSRDIVDNIRQVFTWVRIFGAVIMGMLVIVILLFTLLTVEFRTHSRSEEIEIMQLVGGSLSYIRLPFILEGTIYGVIGATISNIILGILLLIVNAQIASGELNYLQELFSRFNWPELGIVNLIIIFLATILMGAILGAINSFIAISRYIK